MTTNQPSPLRDPPSSWLPEAAACAAMVSATSRPPPLEAVARVRSWASRRRATLVALSLLANLVALLAVVRTITHRGGLAYLKDPAGIVRGESVSMDPDLATYLMRQTMFEHAPEQRAALMFVGDSNTQNCEWSEMFPGAINRGIGGDTSAGLVRRIGSLTKLRPRAIVLMIGTNDQDSLHGTPEQTIANVRATLVQIRRDSPETAVFLQSILPTAWARNNQHILEVNAGLSALAREVSVVYVDLYAAFLEGTVLSPKLSFDGKHVNGDGMALWARLLEPHLSRLGTR